MELYNKIVDYMKKPFGVGRNLIVGGLGLVTAASLASTDVKSNQGLAQLLKPLPAAAQETTLAQRIEQTEAEVKTKPTAESYVKLSDLYFKANKTEEAGNAAREAIKLDQKNFNAYNNLGLYFILTKPPQFDKAKEMLEQSISLNDKNAYAYNTMAFLFYKQKQYKQAIGYATIAIRHDPRLAPSYDIMGACYYYLGYYPKARAAFLQALRIDPNLESSKKWLQFLDSKGV